MDTTDTRIEFNNEGLCSNCISFYRDLMPKWDKDTQDNIKFKGNFKHFVITPEIASLLTNNDPNAQKCCEVLARNIGLRRATGDYLVSTNIDIIHPKRNELENIINSMSKDTFYTISRRHTDWTQIKEFHDGEIKFNDW
jgi:hypothetical protein